jgi:hypothetical protein
MLRVDRGNLGLGRQSRASIRHFMFARSQKCTMPQAARLAKSHLIALDCEHQVERQVERYGNSASGR